MVNNIGGGYTDDRAVLAREFTTVRDHYRRSLCERVTDLNQVPE